MNHSEKTLCGLFEGNRTRVRDIVGDDNGIDDEKACAILADCSASGGTSSRLFPSGLDLGPASML